MAFNPSIPQPTDNISTSQGQLLSNNQALNNVFFVDHVTFSDTTAEKGFHKVIHLTIQAVNPVLMGKSQVFSKNYTTDSTVPATDTQLFHITGLGTVSQLTGHLAGTNGWQWVGGVLIQWGFVAQVFSSGTTTGSVVFKSRAAGCIPFPTQCFLVNTTGYHTAPIPSSEIGISINFSTLSATGFTWSANTDSSQYKGFYWIAIGN